MLNVENKEKELYQAPATFVVEMKQEGVICSSLHDPDDYGNGGDPFGF